MELEQFTLGQPSLGRGEGWSCGLVEGRSQLYDIHFGTLDLCIWSSRSKLAMSEKDLCQGELSEQISG
jgi:hypothetical protein